MKGRKLLFLLALALVMTSALVMSTFAVYTASEDLDGSVESKKFFLEVNKSQDAFIDITLAPGESQVWNFSVSNQSGTSASEVDIDLVMTLVASDYPGQTANPALTISLYEVIEGQPDALIGAINGETGGKGTIPHQDTFEANVGVTKSYKVVIAWDDTDNDIDYVNCKTALKLTVSGTQVTE